LVDLNLRIKTVSEIPVRNLKEEKKNCNCNLSSSFTITGEIFVNGLWHRTKWNINGVNNSGIPSWNLVNY